jgi:hypothetical protein
MLSLKNLVRHESKIESEIPREGGGQAGGAGERKKMETK